MTLEEKTAYHEAGHARLAWSINPASLGSARIFENDDEMWEGDANIDRAGMTVVQKTAIAIAGLLAEARAIAAVDDPTRKVSVGVQLTAELGRVIGIAVENRLAAVPANIPTTVAPAGTTPVQAELSLEDIQYIPDEAADDDEAIEQAATLACDLINHNEEWASFVAIAKKLMELSPDPLEDWAAILAPGTIPVYMTAMAFRP